MHQRTRQSRANNQNPWTPEDDTYLHDACAQGVPLHKICTKLRRSEWNVKLRLVYLGLAERSILGSSAGPEGRHAHQGLPWYPEEEAKLTELYIRGRSPKEMSSEMQRSVSSIMCRLEKLGLIKNRYEYIAPKHIPLE